MKAMIVARRLIKQIVMDKRSMALLLLAPIFVLFLLNVILTSSVSTPNIDIVGAPASIIDRLENDANITMVESAETAAQRLAGGKSDAFLDDAGGRLVITAEGTDPSLSKLVANIVSKAAGEEAREKISALASALQKQNPVAAVDIGVISAQPEIVYLYSAEEITFFDSVAPMMMGFFIFFFVFLLAGISFLRERISGTLDRVLATPLKRSEIVCGYFAGFGLFVAVQTVVIQLFMVYGLGIHVAGSFWLLLLINIVLAAGSLSLGTLLSAYASNEFQLFQFIPLVIVPQILFSGLFDLRDAPQWVIVVSKIFPMTYGANALKDVAIRGCGLDTVWPDLAILSAYAVLFLVLNILTLKKYRKT